MHLMKATSQRNSWSAQRSYSLQEKRIATHPYKVNIFKLITVIEYIFLKKQIFVTTY